MNIEEALTRGVSEVLPLKKGLSDLMKKRKITLYQGFDPSMPSLHLGNLVGLVKLRQFQKLGHEVIFLVGDFTGMIGDPTDKLATRQKLTREDVVKNAENWKKEIENVIDFEGKNKAKLLFNSQWLDKVSFKDLIEITSNFTVQQMVERDMFQERLKKEKPIHLHEFLYPVAQGYDSVVMKVDLEIGGSDQLFNMMAGRTLVKAMNDKEKHVLTTKLLVDKDGRKVGKTTGNALFISSGPNQFFAGVMSFPDDVIYLAFELLTDVPLTGLKTKLSEDPMGEKKRLAREVVTTVWGRQKAEEAEESFEKTFQEREPNFEKRIKKQETLAKTIAQVSTVGSTSEAKRLIQQGAVDVDGKTTLNPSEKLKSGQEVKVGKRTFIKIK